MAKCYTPTHQARGVIWRLRSFDLLTRCLPIRLPASDAR